MVNKVVTKPKFLVHVQHQVDSRVVASVPGTARARLQDKEKHEEIPPSGLGRGC